MKKQSIRALLVALILLAISPFIETVIPMAISADAAYTYPAYFEVTKAKKTDNGVPIAVYHTEPSGSSTTYKIPVGSRITVVDSVKNSSGNIWYKFKKGDGYRWIFEDYVSYRGTITEYSKLVLMETINGGQYWSQPWSKDTSAYTTPASFGNGKVLKISRKINRNGTIWYKVYGQEQYIYSGNVKAHTCSGYCTNPYGYTSIDSTNHQYKYNDVKCSNSTCPNNKAQTVKTVTEKHTWDNGTVTKSPTCTANGSRKYTCTRCGATKTATLTALGHNYQNGKCTRCSAWTVKSTSNINNVKYVVTDDSVKVHNGPYGSCATVATLSKKATITVTQKIVNGEGNTWYKYSGGYVFGDYIKEHSSCTWNSGSVTKAPTCTQTGSKKYTCTLCGATKTSTLKALGHNCKDGKCTRCDYYTIKSRTSVKNKIYYVKASAKVHSGPYGSCATTGSLNKGSYITVTEKIVNSNDHIWYKYNGGYVWDEYLSEHSCSKVILEKTDYRSISQDEHIYNAKYRACSKSGCPNYNCISSVCSSGQKHDFSGNAGICKLCGYEWIYEITSYNAKWKVRENAQAILRTRPYDDNSAYVKTIGAGKYISSVKSTVNKYGSTFLQTSDGYWFYIGNVDRVYTVKYNANGGTGAPSEQVFVSGSQIKIKSTKPVRVGYVFKGWSTTSSGSVNYKGGSVYKEKKSRTLYAVWEKCSSHTYTNEKCSKCSYVYPYESKLQSCSYRAVIVANGKVSRRIPSQDCTDKKSYKKGEIVSITGKTTNSEGHTWYKLSDGYYIYYENVTLQYKVTYNANGGTVSETKKYVNKGSSCTLPTPETRTGYGCLGWATSKAATTATYKCGALYKPSNNITLYAVWKQCTSHNYKYGVCSTCGATQSYSEKSNIQLAKLVDTNGKGIQAYSKPFANPKDTKYSKYKNGSMHYIVAETTIGSTKWYKTSSGRWFMAKYFTKVASPLLDLSDLTVTNFNILKTGTKSVAKYSATWVYKFTSSSGTLYIPASTFKKTATFNKRTEELNNMVTEGANSSVSKSITKIIGKSSTNPPKVDDKYAGTSKYGFGVNTVFYKVKGTSVNDKDAKRIQVEAKYQEGLSITYFTSYSFIFNGVMIKENYPESKYDKDAYLSALCIQTVDKAALKPQISVKLSDSNIVIDSETGAKIPDGRLLRYNIVGKGYAKKELELEDYIDIGLLVGDTVKDGIKAFTEVSISSIYSLGKDVYKLYTKSKSYTESADYKLKNSDDIWPDINPKKDASDTAKHYAYSFTLKSPITLQSKGDYLTLNVKYDAQTSTPKYKASIIFV